MYLTDIIEGLKCMSDKGIILAIETSCDETAAAIISDGRDLLANVVASQIDIHKEYGGVVPEIASRHHLEQVNSVIDIALKKAQITLNELDAIAVTYGPGLVGALLVGVSTAKALSYSLDIPLIGVNHIEGHIYANWLVHDNIQFPLICLVVSGGHTALIEVKNHGEYELLGQTQDDAVGEAYDKIARAMGLGYPGGPIVDSLAQKGNNQAVVLPRAWLAKDSYDFSFSGLKTAVLNYLNRASLKGEKIVIEDLAASFQASVVEVLVEKTMKAAKKSNIKTVMMAGGVAANSLLRQSLSERCEEENIMLYYPPLEFCTDNAAMIASAGYYRYINGERASLYLNAVPNLKLF